MKLPPSRAPRRPALLLVALLLAGVSFWWIRSALPPVRDAAPDAGASARDASLAAPGTSADGAGLSLAPAASPLSPTDPAPAAETIFQVFDTWLASYRASAPEARPALEAAGLVAAQARRAALRELIPRDPAAALRRAVPPALRPLLPAAILAELETPFDRRGDLEVIHHCFGSDPEHRHEVVRFVQLGDVRHRAHVFGRRLTQPTRHGLPLHGLVLEGEAALDEEPLRRLTPGEPGTDALGPQDLAVLIGDEVRVVSSGRALAELRARLLAAETQPGPDVAPLTWALGEERPEVAAAPVAASAWTHGPKRALFIRLAYSDTVEPAPTVPAVTEAMAQAASYFSQVSYGRTSITTTVLPEVLRLPQPMSFYNYSGSSASIRDAALELARAYDRAQGGTGAHDPDAYDLYLLQHPWLSRVGYGGLGTLGGKGTWLNGDISVRVIAHELGHNYGLNHSQAYRSSTGPIAVPGGALIEYGDLFDVMGIGDVAKGFFNVFQKWRLGYLEDRALTIQRAGLHRLYRHDHADATRLQALRVVNPLSGLEHDYWVEYRRLFTDYAALLDGVTVRWGSPPLEAAGGFAGPFLLDLDAVRTAGFEDSALRLGRTFTDPEAALHVTPVAKGGTSPDEWIDVSVEFGARGNNRNPTVTLQPPSGVLRARQLLEFSSAVSDPDGDPVTLRWHFSGLRGGPRRGASTSHRWNVGGDVTVQGYATDGKGGIAQAELALAIEDPLARWTPRAEGLVSTNLNAVTWTGGMFVAVGEAGTVLLSADGVDWVTASSLRPDNLHGVAAGDGRLVAVGSGNSGEGSGSWVGTILTSTDGATWELATTLPTPGALRSVCHGAGRFVAVGDGGQVLSSTDGRSWTRQTHGSQDWHIVRHGGGHFVAAGAGGRVLVSADGLSWTEHAIATVGTLNTLVWTGSQWVAGGGYSEVYRSPDGRVWTGGASWEPEAEMFIQSLLLAEDEVLLAAGAGEKVVLAAADNSWRAAVGLSGGNDKLRSLAAGNGVFIAVGENGRIEQAGQPVVRAPAWSEATRVRQTVAGRPATIGFTRGSVAGTLELLVDGAVVARAAPGATSLAWTPPAFGASTLQLRTTDATGASVRSAPVRTVATLPDWSWVNPALTGANLTMVRHLGGRWWVTGAHGTLLSSSNLATWTRHDLGTASRVLGLAGTADRIVAVVEGWDPMTEVVHARRLLLSSDGGTSWRPVGGSLGIVQAVDYAAGRWVAVGWWGQLWASTDGVTWTPQSLPGTHDLLVSVAAGSTGSTWIAVGYDGRIRQSLDGTSATWISRASGVSSMLNRVLHHGGQWVAVGDSGVVLTSPDGVTWTSRPSGTTEALTGLGVVAGEFVAVSINGRFWRSADGVEWTAVPTGRSIALHAVAGADGVGVAVGDRGEILVRRAGQTAWAPAFPSNTQEIHAGWQHQNDLVLATSAYDSGRNFAMGISILHGPDAGQLTPAIGSTYQHYYDVVRGGSRFVAVGSNGVISTSADGRTWTPRPSVTPEHLRGVSPSPAGGFVVVGDRGTLFTSPDGLDWTPRVSGLTAALEQVVHAAGRYVVVGGGGTLLTSVDGITWETCPTGTTANLRRVGWHGLAGFIALGENNVVLHSTDGFAWTLHPTGFLRPTALLATPLGFVACAGGRLGVSADGRTWSTHPLPGAPTVNELMRTSDGILALLANGQILAHPFTTSDPWITRPPPSVSALGGEQVTLVVEALGEGALSYQWHKDGAPVPGATSASLTLSDLAATHRGAYTVEVTSPAGSVTSAVAQVDVRFPLPALQLATRTRDVRATTGLTLEVTASGPGPFTFQWRRNGRTIAGAVGASYQQAAAQPDDAGLYDVLVTNRYGTAVSEPIDVFVAPAARLFNLSARVRTGPGEDVLIAGFVVEGTRPKQIAITGLGPVLSSVGVPGALESVHLKFFQGGDLIAENRDWALGPSPAVLQQALARIGAVGMRAGSADAAILATVNPGAGYTVHLAGGTEQTRGVGLIEVYEVDGDLTRSRLLNLSARARVGTGADVLIPGLIVSGTQPRRLLIHAVGAGLEPAGVRDFLRDPAIELRSQPAGLLLASNDDAGDDLELRAAAAAIGATPLRAGSKDAGLLATLPPGGYTILVRGVGDTTGVCVVEVFDVTETVP